MLVKRLVCQSRSCTESEEDYGTAGAVLLSWIFSGLGIRQFSVYIVFCNKGVIKNNFCAEHELSGAK